MEEYINEDDERIGEQTDEWMDVPEGRDFISMKESPGSITGYFQGKPILQRSKYGGKKQYWFDMDIIVDKTNGLRSRKTLSTASSKLRKQIKAIYQEHANLFDGEVLCFIQWSGNGMDRSYEAGVLEDPYRS